MQTLGMEIADRLEQWMADDGEFDGCDSTHLDDEAACMMAYFSEMNATEAMALSFLLYYAPVENRMAPADAVPLVLGDTDFAFHFLRCSEDMAYFDAWVDARDTENEIEIEVEETYFEYEEPYLITDFVLRWS